MPKPYYQDKKYQIIYADPPYSYKNKRTGGSMNSGSASKYQVMELKDICALPIWEITDNDCALFLWGTIPLLPEALTVLSAWGFTYKTTIIWRKIMSLGMGFWFRNQVEVCLVGVKGNVKPFRLQRANFIQTKVRKHSQKPDELYEIMEWLPLFPRIELFARSKRNGWDCWGNEVGSDIKLV